MRPRLTFEDISPRGAAVSFRLHPRASTWIPLDADTLDSMAGAPLVYSGGLPVLCHEGSTTPAVRELLLSAGHRVSKAITFRDIESFESALRALGEDGRPIVVSHVLPSDLLGAGAYVVAPDLIIELNDKANLANFTPAQYVLPRRYVPLADIDATAIEPPVVLKASTRLPTGAGFDVAICHDSADVRRAVHQFSRDSAVIDGVVLESFTRFVRSWCAQVAIDDAAISYLGAAEQVCSPEGRWLGNYHGVGHEAPPSFENIASSIARAGQTRGFRGFAGFDIGVDGDGNYWVFDLNFRACGSLLQLLFHSSMCRDADHAVSRNMTFDSELEMRELTARLQPFVRARHFVPTSAFEGAALSGRKSRVIGYALGTDSVHVEELGADMRRAATSRRRSQVRVPHHV